MTTIPSGTPCECGGQVWVETDASQDLLRGWSAHDGDVARCAGCGDEGRVATFDGVAVVVMGG